MCDFCHAFSRSPRKKFCSGLKWWRRRTKLMRLSTQFRSFSNRSSLSLSVGWAKRAFALRAIVSFSNRGVPITIYLLFLSLSSFLNLEIPGYLGTPGTPTTPQSTALALCNAAVRLAITIQNEILSKGAFSSFFKYVSKGFFLILSS